MFDVMHCSSFDFMNFDASLLSNLSSFRKSPKIYNVFSVSYSSHDISDCTLSELHRSYRNSSMNILSLVYWML